MDRQEVRGERRGTRETCSLCPLWALIIGLFWAWHLAQARWDTLTSYLKTRLNDLLTRLHTWHRSEEAGTERKRNREWGGREFDVTAQYSSLISRRTSWPWQVLGVYTARFKGEKTGHFTKTSGLLRDGYERLDAMRIFKVPFLGELRDCRLRVKPTNTHQESARKSKKKGKG